MSDRDRDLEERRNQYETERLARDVTTGAGLTAVAAAAAVVTGPLAALIVPIVWGATTIKNKLDRDSEWDGD